MIRVYTGPYKPEELNLLYEILQTGVDKLNQFCRIKETGECTGCHYKHLCEDLASSNKYLKNLNK